MSLLQDIEQRLLVMHSEGKRLIRITVPLERREELLQLMRRRLLRPSDGVPLHVMGLIVSFEGDEVAIEWEGARDVLQHTSDGLT